MNSDDLTLVEVPAMLRNTFTTPDTPTARRNEALFIRLAREIGYSTIGRAINRDKSFVSRVLSGEVSFSLPELLAWMDVYSVDFAVRGDAREDSTERLHDILSRFAEVLDGRAETHARTFGEAEANALILLAKQRVQQMLTEQEQR